MTTYGCAAVTPAIHCNTDLLRSTYAVIIIHLFTSLSYLLLLIKDFDNPFHWDGFSSVDVDHSVLIGCHDRLFADCGNPAQPTIS